MEREEFAFAYVANRREIHYHSPTDCIVLYDVLSFLSERSNQACVATHERVSTFDSITYGSREQRRGDEDTDGDRESRLTTVGERGRSGENSSRRGGVGQTRDACALEFVRRTCCCQCQLVRRGDLWRCSRVNLLLHFVPIINAYTFPPVRTLPRHIETFVSLDPFDEPARIERWLVNRRTIKGEREREEIGTSALVIRNSPASSDGSVSARRRAARRT